MDVILLEKVGNLGKLGDKVSVKAGYARNFLVPQKKALPINSENLAIFEARRADLERKQGESLADARERAKQLSEIIVVVSSKVGLEGKLFGSVTAANIAEGLSSAGVEVSKREVRLPKGPIRQIGEYEIDVHLHPEVKAVVTVQVVAEE
jgi:large subunit ribosomal protein L9